MRITTANRADGRHCVTLAPEHSHEPNPPLRDLLIDASILGTPGDRQIAITALAFGAALRGVVETAVPVSPAMVQSLSSFQAPAFTVPKNISVEGAQFTGSGTTFVLDLDHEGLVGRNRVDRGRVIALDILPMTRWNGRLFSMDRLVAAANAEFHANRRRGAEVLGPFLAVALAFAHELHVSRIVVPRGELVGDPWIESATRLMASTGVELVMINRNELDDMDLVEVESA
ncbi:MAG: hypothetical protein ACTHV2_01150 [Brachybacterium sp.]